MCILTHLMSYRPLLSLFDVPPFDVPAFDVPPLDVPPFDVPGYDVTVFSQSS